MPQPAKAAGRAAAAAVLQPRESTQPRQLTIVLPSLHRLLHLRNDTMQHHAAPFTVCPMQRVTKRLKRKQA